MVIVAVQSSVDDGIFNWRSERETGGMRGCYISSWPPSVKGALQVSKMHPPGRCLLLAMTNGLTGNAEEMRALDVADSLRCMAQLWLCRLIAAFGQSRVDPIRAEPWHTHEADAPCADRRRVAFAQMGRSGFDASVTRE